MVRVAFGGKGGSGKTTLAAMFTRQLAAGELAAEGVGVSCHHAKTGAVELYLA